MKYLLVILLIIIIYHASAAFGDDPKGTAYSRPNLTGGYDFYDSSGSKVGSSAKRLGGGYNYYNKHGNKTGYIKPSGESGQYSYYDVDNVRRGKLTTPPYGGYRYYEKKEGLEKAEQMQIRRHHIYKDPYGSGLETLSPEVIKGEE